MRILIILLILLLFSCDNSETESASADKNAAVNDTTSKTKKNTLSIEPQKPQTDLHPSQAKVEGRIIEVAPLNNGSMGNLKLKVNKVRGRGRTTPAIGTTDTLEVRIQDTEDYEIGSIIKAIIQYNLTTTETVSQPAWSLVKREN